MLLSILDFCGVLVFAVSGVLTAGRKKMDVFGVFVIAAVTAIGGGTLRDVMIDRYPIFWFRNTTYIAIIAVAVVVTMIYTRLHNPPQKTLLIADAIGLATFTVSGAQIAEHMGLSSVIVIFIATTTAVAGGILRDVLCSEIPLVFQQDVYVVTVITGACVYVILRNLGGSDALIAILTMSTVILFRLVAIFFHLHLPRYHIEEPSSPPFQS
jgi:uncharacterized membrane protein YeiH